MQKIAIITDHGVGRTQKAKKYADDMKAYFEKKGLGYSFHQYSYQHLIESLTDEYFEDNFPKPSWRHPNQRATWYERKVFFDYAADSLVMMNIMPKLLKDFNKFVKSIDCDEIILIGHSAGCFLMHEWLKMKPYANVIRFYTMGCNLPVFQMGRPDPIFSQDSILDIWLNIWEYSDILSMPLAKFYPGVTDYRWHAKGLKGKTPLIHNEYWNSKKVFKVILKDILRDE